MSKRHQVSRRRSYGRRQHELHERMDRLVAVMNWDDESPYSESIRVWGLRPEQARASWPQPQGVK